MGRPYAVSATAARPDGYRKLDLAQVSSAYVHSVVLHRPVAVSASTCCLQCLAAPQRPAAYGHPVVLVVTPAPCFAHLSIV